MRIRSTLQAILVAIAATTALITPADAAGGVRITRVYFDSPGPDRGSNTNLNAEYVDIRNNGSHARVLTGWTLRERGADHVYVFPRFTLKAKAKVRVHTGSGADTRRNQYWDARAYVWNNTGDKATLRNKAGNRIDVCTFSGAGSVAAC